MSSEIAIKVENLSKCYNIYDRPRDRLMQMLARGRRQYFREFRALSDVSFEIKQGETVGIIGRNGAGKSTLLQILCGTLSPTGGTVETRGRVAALLELGSGFNPEFTGRENVYMNAAVLGLTKEEVDARFEDIVAFADIGDFLDQPVKTYSSGMYVRLAFAVVVHVDADILIVDEALSVGDMYFQAKCMSHMKKLMDSGVTVLFVSHDTNAVKALCTRAVYLEHGKVVAVGATDEVVDAYYGAGVKSAQSLQPRPEITSMSECPRGFSEDDLAEQQEFAQRAAFHRIQNGMAEWLNVKLLDVSGRRADQVDFGQTIVLRMLFKGNVDVHSIGMGYHIRDRNGVDVIYSDTGIENCHITNLRAGEIVMMDWEFTVHLREGEYTVTAMLSIPEDLSVGKVEVCDFAPLAANFKVARGKCLPIYGAAYWPNRVKQQRFAA
jgi:lipopolysaccharide transport system ATP-binding protein